MICQILMICNIRYKNDPHLYNIKLRNKIAESEDTVFVFTENMNHNAINDDNELYRNKEMKYMIMILMLLILLML